MTEDMFAQKGWICPKCGRVLAPSTMYCLWCCSDMKESITTTGTSIPKWNTTPIKVGSGMINSNGTGGSYFVETSSISRDSHEIAKTEPTGYNLSPVDKDINVRSKDEPQTDGILFKGNLKEGEYKLIKTSNGWVLEGNDIAYCGEPQTDCPWK